MRSKTSQAILCALFLVPTLSLLRCDIPSPATTAQTLSTGELIYRLQWELGAAQPSPDGLGWVVDTDLGYTVHVESGWISTYSVQLIECEDQDDAHTHDDDDLAALWNAVAGSGVAWAGHSGETDASISTAGVVETLDGTMTAELAAVTVTNSTRYCEAHWLAFRADDTVQGNDDGSLDGRTLWLTGTYRAPGDDVDSPFIIETSLGNGVILGLPTVIDTASTGAVITVRRELGRLFDGVEFATDADARIEQRILANLVASASVVVYPGDADVAAATN